MPLADLLLKRRLKRGKELEDRLPERHGEGAAPPRRSAGLAAWRERRRTAAVFPLIEASARATSRCW